MTDQEKLAALEDLLDVPEGSLTPATSLSTLEEWDSISVIGYLAILDEKFHKTATGDDVRGFAVVQDAMDMMHA